MAILSKRRILIVEDDTYLAQLYKIKLEALGYEVSLMETGEGVVDFVISNTIDAVILDIVLPKKDGMTVHTELKDEERTKHIPVFILSVIEEGNVKARLLQDGVSDLKSKQEATLEEVVTSLVKLLT